MAHTLFALIIVYTVWLGPTLAADCSGGDPYLNFTCPQKGGFYCEFGSSLSSELIIRCIDGCPEPGNCNDDLFCYPPGTGDKGSSLCYEDSSNAGNAQCTDNCVNVTQTDGHVFYPVGCISSLLSINTVAESACATPNTNYSTLPVPSGFITGSASSGSVIVSTTSHSSSASRTGSTTASATASSKAAASFEGRSNLAIIGILLVFGVLLVLA